jgi:hypothetical protein
VDCRTIVVSRHPRGGDPDHSNSPERFSPRCSRYRVVQPVGGAGECRSACRATEPHCIKLVTVEMVFEAALDLLPIAPSAAYQHNLAISIIAPMRALQSVRAL